MIPKDLPLASAREMAAAAATATMTAQPRGLLNIATARLLMPMLVLVLMPVVLLLRLLTPGRDPYGR